MQNVQEEHEKVLILHVWGEGETMGSQGCKILVKDEGATGIRVPFQVLSLSSSAKWVFC